jgi:hypothetical protein
MSKLYQSLDLEHMFYAGYALGLNTANTENLEYRSASYVWERYQDEVDARNALPQDSTRVRNVVRKFGRIR